MRIFTLLFLTLLLASCGDPVVMIPGKKLSGTVNPVPVAWQNVPETIQLETRPTDPYSVNIWGVGIGANLYVATRDASWVPFISEDPQVRARLDGKIYELTATQVTAKAEIKQVLEAYIVKYDVEESESFIETGQVFRLDRR